MKTVGVAGDTEVEKETAVCGWSKVFWSSVVSHTLTVWALSRQSEAGRKSNFTIASYRYRCSLKCPMYTNCVGPRPR